MTENPATEPSVPARRPRRRRLWRFALIAVGAVVLGLLALPAILSSGLARSRVAAIATDALHTAVTLDSLDVGWTGDVGLTGLVIAQPDGFDHPEPLLRLDRAAADVALTSLLGGRIGLHGTASGARLVVIQRADGSTNVQALGERRRPAGEPGPGPAPDPDADPGEGGTPGGEVGADDGPDLADVRLDLRLTDAEAVILHAERGLLETLTGVTASITKPFGTEVVKVDFAAGLAHGGDAASTGRIALQADLRATADASIDARLDAEAVELGRLQPLLAAFLGDDALERFAGRLEADIRVQGQPSGEFTSSGTLTVERPDIAGRLTQGLRLTAPRWTVRTDASGRVPSGAGELRADLSKLAVDLGFLTLRGTEAAPGRAGFTFGIDVAALATEGSPIPALLAGTGTRLDGRFDLPLDLGIAAKPLTELLAAVTVDATLKVDRIEYASQALTGLGLDLGLDGGRARIAASTGQLAGGALRLTVEADAAQLRGGRVSFDVGVEGAQLQGGAVTALRYAVPLFAGLEAGAQATRFEALGDLRLAARGPLLPAEGQSILAWLGGFGGEGSVALRDGGFVPAAGLSQLTGFVARLSPQAGVLPGAGAGAAGAAGDGGRLLFDRIGTTFSLDGGVIRSDTTDVLPGGEELALVGTTSLAGEIDHTLDLRGLFRGHRDGEKVLKYLGDAPLGAKLTGSLTDPRLALPQLEDLLQRAMQNALQQEGRDALKDLLEGITGKKQGEAADPLHDAIEQGVGKVLEGVLGGAGPQGGEGGAELQKGLEEVLKGIVGGAARDGEGGATDDPLRRTAEDLLKGVLGGDRGARPRDGQQGDGKQGDGTQGDGKQGDGQQGDAGPGQRQQSPVPNPLDRLIRGLLPPAQPPRRGDGQGGGTGGGNGGGTAQTDRSSRRPVEGPGDGGPLVTHACVGDGARGGA